MNIAATSAATAPSTTTIAATIGVPECIQTVARWAAPAVSGNVSDSANNTSSFVVKAAAWFGGMAQTTS